MLTAFRASILHCLADPVGATDHNKTPAVEYLDDGLLIVEKGFVQEVGAAEALLPGLSGNVDVVDYSDKLITPGLIDCHVHYPQIDIIASYGEQLLDWLNKYAFPAEQKFADAGHAAEVADFFVDELLRNGTTTALVFATVHPQSVDAIFDKASKLNMRLLSGKVLMDKNCPEDLRDDACSQTPGTLQRLPTSSSTNYCETAQPRPWYLRQFIHSRSTQYSIRRQS